MPASDLERSVPLRAFSDPAQPAWARRLHVDLEGSAAEVVSLADLIEMKRRAGRPQDLADVRELEAIARELRGRGDG